MQSADLGNHSSSASSASAASRPSPTSVTPARNGIRAVLRTLFLREFVQAPPGPLRLFDGRLSAQFAWFLPLAAAGFCLGLRQSDPGNNVAAAGDGRSRGAIWFFVLWSATCWALYSSLGGIIHYYYLVPLLPPLSALSAVGATLIWRRANRSRRGIALIAGMLLLSGMWQVYIHTDALGDAGAPIRSANLGWHNGPLLAMLLGCLLALIGLFAIGRQRNARGSSGIVAGFAALGLASLLVVPACWALSSVLVPRLGLLPSADIYRLIEAKSYRLGSDAARRRRAADTKALAQFLIANRGEARYLLTTTTSMVATPLIIETGEPVLARGGYHGLDQSLNPEKLAALVQSRALRFAMVGDVSAVVQPMGGDAADKPVSDWIRLHGTRVDPILWRKSSARGNVELFDLRPGAGLAQATP